MDLNRSIAFVNDRKSIHSKVAVHALHHPWRGLVVVGSGEASAAFMLFGVQELLLKPSNRSKKMLHFFGLWTITIARISAACA